MRTYLNSLDRNGELLTVSREVDPKFELAAVTKAAQLESDRPLLFERVRGTKFPVVTSVYSSRERVCEMIGATDGNFCRRWNEILDRVSARTASATVPAEVPAGLAGGKLSDLPPITYHGKDAGPYFTSAIYLANDPDTGVPNLSFHRSQIINDRELRVRLGTSHDLARYQKRAEEKGRALDAALLLSVTPDIFMAACASIPADWNELAVAAEISGAPLPVHRARKIDLDIPLGAHIVVEGRFLPNERRAEGPFGEVLGYYVPEGQNHVFEVLAVYWHPEALFHSILCGSSEDLTVLQLVTAARTYRHLSAVLPGIVDVTCAPAFMNTTIKIRQQYEGHARQVLLAAFGAHIDYNKVCIVVDEDVEFEDMNEVLWAFVTRGRADQRVLVIDDVPGFYRDPHRDHWGRLGIDATKPFDRQAEFERKTIPGIESVKLADYLKR
jgi:4-hydroxybenzoate decarboxylase